MTIALLLLLVLLLAFCGAKCDCVAPMCAGTCGDIAACAGRISVDRVAAAVEEVAK